MTDTEPNETSALKLHIGCGDRYLPGYKHIDARKLPHVDYVTDRLDNLDMFADNSVDEIYTSGLLEHLPRAEFKGKSKILSEWHRILKVGGVLRIAVPDFKAVVDEYSASKDLELIMGLLYGRQNYKYNFHYQIFDFERLAGILKENGFSKVEHYDWRDFIPDGYDDGSRAYLPHMDFEHGRLMSLNVVAIK